MLDGGAAPRLKPFRFNTREREKYVGAIAYPSGGGDGTPLTLPPIGLLGRVFCVFEGSVTFSAGTTYANYGVWGLIKRIKLQLNNASQDLCDMSGYGLFLVNSISRKVNKIDETAGLDSALYAAPTSGAAQNFRVAFEIPVNQSQGFNFEAGLINLQAPEVQCTLNATFASSLTDIGTNITAFSGNLYVYYRYFEVPNPMEVVIPPLVLHKWVEQQQPITSTGDNVYTVPRAGKVGRLIHVVNLNGARSDSYDSAVLKLQQSDTIYQRDKRLVKWHHRTQYGNALPTGVIVQDFAQAWDVCEESDGRDFFDSERTTTMESIVSVSSSATLGTNNNSLISIREILQVPAQ